MASNIDVSVPTPVRATTKSVRDNFIAAKDEIEALQDNESATGADILDEKNRNDAQDVRLDQLEEDVSNIEVTITTSMVETEVGDGTREAEPSLTNQKEVNNYLWETVSNLEPYDDEEIQKSLEELQEQIDALFEATKPEPERLPIFAEDEPTEYPHVEEGELNDLAPKDQWYQVTDPDFDYDNPTTDGLDLYIWTDVEGEFEWVLFEVEIPEGVVIIKSELPDMEEDAVNNGSLWFDNSEDTMQLFVYHSDSSAWLPVAPPTTLEGRVSAGEATQAEVLRRLGEGEEKQEAITYTIQNSLDTQAKIVAKVEELSITKGAVSRYTVKGTEINVATRNGELYVNSPNAVDVTYISFAPFDSNGQATKPANPDDIVEFVEAAGGRGAGEITRYKVVSGDYNALTVEYLSGTNDFEVDEAEEVYVYPQNQDLASIEYVDQGLSSKLDNSGANQLPDDTDWKVRQHNSEGKNKTLIHSVGGRLGVYNLKEPVESHHAATKGYVDSKSSDNSGNGGVSASRPPGLKFMCSIVNLPNGYFQWWVKESTGNQHLELAVVDRDGISWGANTPREDVRYSDKIPFTIWEVSGGGWKMKVTGTISRIDFHPDHALCYVSSNTALNGGNFANGSGPYYITIGGIM